MIRWSRLALGVTVTLLASGCALQDTRYDYSRAGTPFPDYDETIIDWNFPTSANQGFLTAPERFQPWRPALGVPWAYGNPQTPSPVQPPVFSPISDGASAPADAPHDAAPACGEACVAPAVDADADVRLVVRDPADRSTR